MKKGRKSKNKARALSRLSLLEKLIDTVASLMLSEGFSEAKIEIAIRNGLKAASEGQANMSVPALSYLSLSTLLHSWHQNSEFLNSNARPAALTLRGRRNSIEALAVASGVPVPIEKLIYFLKKQNLIRRVARGKYEPTSERAQLEDPGRAVGNYLAHAIFNLIETVQLNHAEATSLKPLLERAAIVQDLPVREAKEFRRFSAEQGANLVSNVSAWLESRRQKSRNGRPISSTVTAGLHVFAFVSKVPSGR